MRFRVLRDTKSILPFVSAAHTAADKERDALGFLPKVAYEEAAFQQKLLIAIDGNSGSYAGHLLFGGVFPNLRIFQVAVEPNWRGMGVGDLLVRELLDLGEKAQFLSVSARVASDLRQANAFWSRQGFKTVRTVVGGHSRGRTINVRILDLRTPSLLSLMGAVSAPQSDLRLIERLTGPSATYLIDLNIMFDVTKRRTRAEEAARIIAAAFDGLIKIAVSSELLVELRRTSVPGSDPLLSFSEQMPALPAPPNEFLETHLPRLAQAIFPSRANSDALKPRDRSDLTHILTAAHHRVAGFVTHEKAILRAREFIQDEFGIDVIGARELGAMIAVDAEGHAAVRYGEIRAGAKWSFEYPERLDEILAFLSSAPRADLERIAIPAPEAIQKQYRTIVAKIDGELVAFCSWEKKRRPKMAASIIIYANEARAHVSSILDHLLLLATAELSRSSPALLHASSAEGHFITRQALLAHGFRPGPNGEGKTPFLQKIASGLPVTAENWLKFRSQLASTASIKLPRNMPAFDDLVGDVPVVAADGSSVTIPAKELESLLAPVLFLFHNRPAALIPISRGYAEELFGSSPQYSLLDKPEAILLRERTYLGSAKLKRTIKEGSVALFYESGRNSGRGVVFAAGRVTRVDEMLKTAPIATVLRSSVIRKADIQELGPGNRVATIAFDNILHFKRTVTFAELKKMGCVSRANLVTAEAISTNQASLILRKGFESAE